MCTKYISLSKCCIKTPRQPYHKNSNNFLFKSGPAFRPTTAVSNLYVFGHPLLVLSIYLFILLLLLFLRILRPFHKNSNNFLFKSGPAFRPTTVMSEPFCLLPPTIGVIYLSIHLFILLLLLFPRISRRQFLLREHLWGTAVHPPLPLPTPPSSSETHPRSQTESSTRRHVHEYRISYGGCMTNN